MTHFLLAAVLDVAKNGVTYVTENLEGVDYLIGASDGAVYSSESAHEEGRVLPRESTSDIIRESYDYMVGTFGLNDNMLPGSAEYPFGVNYTGSVFEGIGQNYLLVQAN